MSKEPTPAPSRTKTPEKSAANGKRTLSIVPRWSETDRECRVERCENLALHRRERCFKHIPRTRFEHWLDLHNHKMELARTLFGFSAFVMQLIVLYILLVR